MSASRAAAVFATVAVVGSVACGGARRDARDEVVRTTPLPDSSLPSVDPCGAATDAREDAAYTASCRALRYLVEHPSDDPLAELYVDVVARRFGLTALGGRWATLERTLPRDPRPAARALQRLGDADAPLPAAASFAAMASDERLLVAALHCDRQPLSEADGRALRALGEQPLFVRLRGLEALVVARDRGCVMPDGVTSALIDGVASGLSSELRVADAPPVAVAFGSFLLRYAGYARFAPRAADEALLARQNPDGSFGSGSPAEVTLATACSLGALLELRRNDRTELWATLHARGRYERRPR